MKVITENDLRFFHRHYPDKEFVMEAETLLTPSAKSYLKESKLPVKINEVTLKKTETQEMSKEELSVSPELQTLGQGSVSQIEKLLEEKNLLASKNLESFNCLWHHELLGLQILLEELSLLHNISVSNQQFYQEQMRWFMNLQTDGNQLELRVMNQLDSLEERLLLRKIIYQIETLLLLVFEKLDWKELQLFRETPEWLFFNHWQQLFRKTLMEGGLLLESE